MENVHDDVFSKFLGAKALNCDLSHCSAQGLSGSEAPSLLSGPKERIHFFENSIQQSESEGVHSASGHPFLLPPADSEGAFSSFNLSTKIVGKNKIKSTKVAKEEQSDPIGEKAYLHEIKDKKKRRRERNKFSARESRRKKKQYIEILEGEVKALTAELTQCKLQLSHSSSCSLPILCSQNLMDQFSLETERMIEKLILAFRMEDYNAIEITLQGLLSKCGMQSEERIRGIETSIQKAFEAMLPKAYRYLLYAAERNVGYFNVQNIIKEESFIMLEEKKVFWDDIQESVKLSDIEMMQIHKLKDSFKSSLKELRVQSQNFMEAKQNMQKEITKLHNLVDSNIISKFPTSKIVAYIDWVKQKELQELDIFSLFCLNPEDYGGISSKTEKFMDYSGSFPRDSIKADRRNLKRPRIFEGIGGE